MSVAEALRNRLLARLNNANEAVTDEQLGRLGAVLFGSKDSDVVAMRQPDNDELTTDEMPWLIAKALPLLNDSRILAISCDGDHKSSEVIIDVVGGTSLTVSSGRIGCDDTAELEAE